MLRIASLIRKLKISSPIWARHGRTSPETRNFAGTKPPLPISNLVIIVVRIGPEKGVIHIATAAVGNALWDMYARSRSKPLWKLVVDMTPVRLPPGRGTTIVGYLLDPIGRACSFYDFPIHHRCNYSRRSPGVAERKGGWQSGTRSKRPTTWVTSFLPIENL